MMLSEAALENPAIFGGHPTSRATQLDATRQYLRLARAHPPRTSSVIKAHLFKLLYLTLQAALRPGTTAPRHHCALAPAAATATSRPCILCAAAPHAPLHLPAPPEPVHPSVPPAPPLRASRGSSTRTSTFASGWARRYCSTRSSPWARRCARRRSSSCRRLRRPCASGATRRAVSASRGIAATGRTRAQWCPSKRTRSRRPRPLSRWSRSTRAASASLARMGTHASKEGRKTPTSEPRPHTDCLRWCTGANAPPPRPVSRELASCTSAQSSVQGPGPHEGLTVPGPHGADCRMVCASAWSRFLSERGCQ